MKKERSAKSFAIGRAIASRNRRRRVIVYKRDGGVCQRCESGVTEKDAILHHVVHKSDGGTDHTDNRMLTCLECETHYHNVICKEGEGGGHK